MTYYGFVGADYNLPLLDIDLARLFVVIYFAAFNSYFTTKVPTIPFLA